MCRIPLQCSGLTEASWSLYIVRVQYPVQQYEYVMLWLFYSIQVIPQVHIKIHAIECVRVTDVKISK